MDEEGIESLFLRPLGGARGLSSSFGEFWFKFAVIIGFNACESPRRKRRTAMMKNDSRNCAAMKIFTVETPRRLNVECTFANSVHLSVGVLLKINTS